MATLATLRKHYTVDQAAGLLDQARLRQKAVAKFGALAPQMLFVDEALQQASGQTIARYRATRYASFAHDEQLNIAAAKYGGLILSVDGCLLGSKACG